MKLLLRGGRVVDPASGTDEVLDVLIEDGALRRIGSGGDGAGADELQLEGRVLCPGFIDMHVHLREPGQSRKETVAAGTAAAARGGFTAVACMPNTDPPNDSVDVTRRILDLAARGAGVRVHPVACVTLGQRGEKLVEMEQLAAAGARAFSDDGHPVRSSSMMYAALQRASRLGLPVIDHCEDPDLVAGGVVNAGEAARRHGVAGWRAVAEDVMVQRNVLLAEDSGGHVHIAHMSTARSAEFVRQGKRRGARVTCEVTPHHLLLDDSALDIHGTNAKMNPPLRSADDCAGLVAALTDGTVDAIATDHAPHHVDEKRLPLAEAPFGVVGLETAVALCLDRLVHGGAIPLARLVELFSSGPAAVLGLDRGRLREGGAADLTVLDLERRERVDPDAFASLGRNTPFGGQELRGAPWMTIVAGRILYDASHSDRLTEGRRAR